MGKPLTGQGETAVCRHRSSLDFQCGRFQKGFRLLVIFEQGLHFPEQFLVARTGLHQKDSALRRLPTERRAVDRFDFRPPFRFHSYFIELSD